MADIGTFTGLPRDRSGERAAIRQYLDDVISGRVFSGNVERYKGLLEGVRDRDPGALGELTQEVLPMGGLAGIMAGPMARTANPVARNLAEQLKEQGRSPEDIWRITGERHGQPWWLEHPDQVPRFEISDDLLEYEPNLYSQWLPSVQEGRIGEAVGHQGLFDAYPDLPSVTGRHYPRWDEDMGLYRTSPREEINVWERPGSEWGETSHGVMGHELQHAVQQRERMARGGRPEEFALGPGKLEAFKEAQSDVAWARRLQTMLQGAEGDMEKASNLYEKRFKKRPSQEIAHKAMFNTPEQLKLELDSLTRRLRDRSGFEQYQRLGGEMDARATQQRLRMTPQERIARPFWLDYDMPIDDMILRR